MTYEDFTPISPIKPTEAPPQAPSFKFSDFNLIAGPNAGDLNDGQFGFPGQNQAKVQKVTDPSVLNDIDDLKMQCYKHREKHQKNLNEIIRITDKHHRLEA